MDILTDENFMQLALKEAQKALKKDEVPVGAIIVRDGKVIAKAHNLRETSKMATHHAEILAIEKACRKIHDFRLSGCQIFVTMEPCVMCMGAILNARIEKLIFGAKINKEEALTAREINERAMLNFKTEIKSGVLEKDCSNLVSQYFKSKRIQN